jgi:hypothetical protein
VVEMALGAGQWDRGVGEQAPERAPGKGPRRLLLGALGLYGTEAEQAAHAAEAEKLTA